MDHSRRFYRNYKGARGANFNVKLHTTDLFITADRDLSAEAYRVLEKVRQQLDDHIAENREFLYSLNPLEPGRDVPEIAGAMYLASEAAGVGPMAAVAGAVAEAVGQSLLEFSDEVIVENGGDIWLKINTPALIGVYVNNIHFNNRLWLKMNPADTPCSVCTSTSKLGHSLSFGKADSATIIAKSGALADAVATGACNMVQGEEDLTGALEYAMSVTGVTGCMIIYHDKLAAQGNIEFGSSEG